MSEHPFDYDMITVGHYQPLAGRGANTIRRLSDKYTKIGPGDIVRMRYATDFDPEVPTEPTAVIATELLRVSAVVIGNFHEIISSHGLCNHAVEDGAEIDDLIAHLERSYPDAPEGSEYIAIYFD